MQCVEKNSKSDKILLLMERTDRTKIIKQQEEYQHDIDLLIKECNQTLTSCEELHRKKEILFKKYQQKLMRNRKLSEKITRLREEYLNKLRQENKRLR